MRSPTSRRDVLPFDPRSGTGAEQPARRPHPRAAVEAAVELLEEGGYSVATVAAIADAQRRRRRRPLPSLPLQGGAVRRGLPNRGRGRARQACTRRARCPARSSTSSTRSCASTPAAPCAQPRLAWALGYEPVDPLVDAERLVYRRTYRERLTQLLQQGIAAGELPEQDAELTAAALIGAISEALVGPLSPVPDKRVDEERLVAAVSTLCRRAIGGLRA